MAGEHRANPATWKYISHQNPPASTYGLCRYNEQEGTTKCSDQCSQVDGGECSTQADAGKDTSYCQGAVLGSAICCSTVFASEARVTDSAPAHSQLRAMGGLEPKTKKPRQIPRLEWVQEAGAQLQLWWGGLPGQRTPPSHRVASQGPHGFVKRVYRLSPTARAITCITCVSSHAAHQRYPRGNGPRAC